MRVRVGAMNSVGVSVGVGVTVSVAVEVCVGVVVAVWVGLGVWVGSGVDVGTAVFVGEGEGVSEAMTIAGTVCVDVLVEAAPIAGRPPPAWIFNIPMINPTITRIIAAPPAMISIDRLSRETRFPTGLTAICWENRSAFLGSLWASCGLITDL